jgi:excisionase family DNA binding protein
MAARVLRTECHTGIIDVPVILRLSHGKGVPMTGNTWGDVKFLTIYELAVIMRISKMSAYRLVHSGELEAIRVGRSYRIPEQAVITYMRGAAYTPTGLAS